METKGALSYNGVATVINFKTGQPLDYEVLSNFRVKCKLKEGNDPSDERKKQHTKNCLKISDGSVNAMEVQ